MLASAAPAAALQRSAVAAAASARHLDRWRGPHPLPGVPPTASAAASTANRAASSLMRETIQPRQCSKPLPLAASSPQKQVRRTHREAWGGAGHGGAPRTRVDATLGSQKQCSGALREGQKVGVRYLVPMACRWPFPTNDCRRLDALATSNDNRSQPNLESHHKRGCPPLAQHDRLLADRLRESKTHMSMCFTVQAP